MAGFPDLLDALRRRLGDDLAAGPVIAARDVRSPIDLERIPLLVDADGAFRRAYGVTGGHGLDEAGQQDRPEGSTEDDKARLREWCDAGAFFGKLDPMEKLMTSYQEPLRRLANR